MLDKLYVFPADESYKLKTALSRDRLASLAPLDNVFFSCMSWIKKVIYMYVATSSMWCSVGSCLSNLGLTCRDMDCPDDGEVIPWHRLELFFSKANSSGDWVSSGAHAMMCTPEPDYTLEMVTRMHYILHYRACIYIFSVVNIFCVTSPGVSPKTIIAHICLYIALV